MNKNKSSFKRKLKVYSDGGARGNPGPAASAFIVLRSNKVIQNESKYLGNATNNFAEYTGVLMALKWLKDNLENSKEQIHFLLDSELVVNQLKGKYKIKSENLKPIINQIKTVEKNILNEIIYYYIPREKNKLADYLVNKVLDAHK